MIEENFSEIKLLKKVADALDASVADFYEIDDKDKVAFVMKLKEIAGKNN